MDIFNGGLNSIDKIVCDGEEICEISYNGQTVWEDEYLKKLRDPLTITIDEDSIDDPDQTLPVSISKVGSPYDASLEYRLGDGEWQEYVFGDVIQLGLNVKLQFRAVGGNENFSKDLENYYVINADFCHASGNTMSLLDKTMKRTDVPAYCFYRLFYGQENLCSMPELPAETLGEYCYAEMFKGCIEQLMTPLKLPAKTLAKGCYYEMFRNCSITSAPELQAVALEEGCYMNMFDGCNCLKTPPALDAVRLAKGCYANMFIGCTALTSAPELPAATLAENCYSDMFSGCMALKQAPELPATELAENCYMLMFAECASLTAAPALPATILTDRCYAGMFGGTGITAAPDLPATELAYRCYDEIFTRCDVDSVNMSKQAEGVYDPSTHGKLAVDREITINYAL